MTAFDQDDLFAPEVIADPYAYFGHLRETDPLHWNARASLWVITRYDDLVWLVRHHELFSSAVIKGDQRPPTPPIDPDTKGLFEQVREFRSDQLVEKDRPDHTRMRDAITSISRRPPWSRGGRSSGPRWRNCCTRRPKGNSIP